MDTRPKRAERGRAFPQRKPRRLPEQMRAGDVGQVAVVRRREFCRTNALFGERIADQIGESLVDGDDFVGRAGQGPQQQQVRPGRSARAPIHDYDN